MVPGFPDRLVPKSEAAAATLNARTLIKLYNARPAWLADAHRALDAGWPTPTAGATTGAGRLGDDEAMARLFSHDEARAGDQATSTNPPTPVPLREALGES